MNYLNYYSEKLPSTYIILIWIVSSENKISLSNHKSYYCLRVANRFDLL